MRSTPPGATRGVAKTLRKLGLGVLGGVIASWLAGCGLDTRYEAASDVRDMLTAAQTGDAKTFEAHIDRPKLKENVREQVMQNARAQGIEVGGGPSEAALDRMIAPDAFRLVKPSSGGEVPETPSQAEIALMLDVEGRTACLRQPGAEDASACLMAFEKQGGTWKLVAVQAADMRISG